MTPHAKRIAALLHKGGFLLEWIAALGAEEMPNVVFTPRGEDDLAFDRRFAAATSWGEELVEVEVAVEPQRVIFGGQTIGFESREALILGFGVEGHTFEGRVAVGAGEAVRVEAGFLRLGGVRGGNDAAGYGEGTGGASGGWGRFRQPGEVGAGSCWC